MENTKEEKIVEQPEEKKIEEAPVKKGFSIKFLAIGLPLFIVQLVGVYFITANILIPKIQSHSTPVETDSVATSIPAEDTISNPDLGKYIYVVDDLIINPAGTDGKRLLLSSLGFDLPSEKSHSELKDKEILVKDAIISVLSSKDMIQLGNSGYRDTLRMQITQKLNRLMPHIKINNVYFSKYILQ
ncbi:MAG TPA: flagellar basal body-associated FliL family protein [Melioribacteraceae bacterium]|nr:flagellar basal body-associated FliL family protein [Melioribacteraceae bacterium]